MRAEVRSWSTEGLKLGHFGSHLMSWLSLLDFVDLDNIPIIWSGVGLKADDHAYNIAYIKLGT